MSNRLPSREQAIELLRKNNCPPEVISHCEAVADLALEIASKLEKKGLKIDLNLLKQAHFYMTLVAQKPTVLTTELSALKLLNQKVCPNPVVNIIKRHVGGGITAEEAESFGWPKDVYCPVTLEEKIVSYADKLIDQSKRVPIDLEIERLQQWSIRKQQKELESFMKK